jgi:nanoRNase/pAp phosphatase (c-di-AMP/oligoRNAs hydrolase)
MPPFNFGEYVPNEKHAELILMGIACNVTGDFKSTNATDKACLELVMRAGRDINTFRE